MNALRLMVSLAFAALLAGCMNLPYNDPLATYHEVKPTSILVVPVVNESVDVQAPSSVLTTLPKLLGEKGYYVFPVNTVKTILEFEGLYEPAEIHQLATSDLASWFGADAVLYVTIHEWTSRYVVISTTTEVDFEYRIVDKNGVELWTARENLSYTPQNESQGGGMASLLSSAITAAVERAAPNYLPLTREANAQAFYYGYTPLPPGPYSHYYEQYYQQLAEEKAAAEAEQ
ncbi:hypothetical protein BGP77_16060 [Saccharospirillum sp. MSK14-1]|uniref:DUF799 domain-containing protein n=1 Tax=Saccharospirillum sp. MSK14-1 TaxID=1897632 RepID=UPI000D370BF8|nr:GNA1162 family protein [Saccharospirillum sp. MSK14-1]PTY37974.1 hypothetical protein BGP77_16060 [Saccharospirillum sp. MSK14-1]